MTFCSGLGGATVLSFSFALVALSLSCEGLALAPEAVPGRTVSLPASELRLLFTLAPGDGEAGFWAIDVPLSVGICELLLPGGAPSEDLMSRVAAGWVLLELEPGFDLSFLKKKLILSYRADRSRPYDRGRTAKRRRK